MKQLINDRSIFVSGLCYFVIMLAFIVLRIVFGAGFLGNVTNDTTDFVFTFIVQVLVLFLVPFLFMRFFAKQPSKTVFKRNHFRKIDGKMILWSLLLGVCTYAIILFVSSFWSGILSIFGYSSGSGVPTTPATDYPFLNFLLGILFIGVLPGFCEEFTHRGMVLGNIKKDGVGRAILFSALLFGLMHLNIAQLGYAFVVGLILGTVTLLTKSIFPAMITHCVSNSISTYLTYAQDNGWFGGNFYDWINSWLNGSNMIATFLFSTLILCILVTLIFYIMVSLFKNAKRNDFKNFKKRLAKNLKENGLEGQIDLNNDVQVFKLYQESQFVNLQKKLLTSSLTPDQIEKNIDKTTLLSLMFDEDVTKKAKIKHMDYLFYYCSIFLGAVVTIMTFIWGVI